MLANTSIAKLTYNMLAISEVYDSNPLTPIVLEKY